MSVLLLALAFAPAAFAAPVGQAVTKTGHEIIQLPKAQCDQMKADHPSLAADPTLCQIEHGWTETTVIDSPSGLAPSVAASCPSGTSSFHDWLTGGYDFWQHDMDTSFRWYGNCSYPTLTGQNCYIEWAINSTFSDLACYSYHFTGSGWTSTAAVDTFYVCTSIGGQTICSNNSQRRECYSGSVGNCNWTAWNGR